MPLWQGQGVWGPQGRDCVCQYPTAIASAAPLVEIHDLYCGVSRPQLCDPMIPGDLLLQGQQDPEALFPVSPF